MTRLESAPATASLAQPRHDVQRTAGLTPGALRSSKIGDRHHQRLAIVYVRQSTPQQVVDHQESTARQYALADHAVALGWPRDRVLVIDEDQGHSGTSVTGRSGYQRLLAEVSLEQVGLVLGLEMSRLARSSKDWYHLVEVCAVFGTLLGDQDGIYDPADVNDRMLLGLKGTMSEFELVTMRNRLERGRRHKAARGEYFTKAPVGYIKLPTGAFDLDPDEQARAVVQLIFDKYDQLGTVWGVFRYLLRHGIRLGVRVHAGAERGQLQWRRPSLHTLYQLLRHPLYAGAYVYGRRAIDYKRRALRGSRAGLYWLPREQWQVLLRDRLPAYITWERYEANQERLRKHRSRSGSPGTPRPGATLLAGLVYCGQCGRQLRVSYPRGPCGYYSCLQNLRQGEAPSCHGVSARVLDELVEQQLLRALQPAALELSLQAVADIERERQRLARHHEQQLQRARYQVERAERQYQAVEPENRLVARTLEARWEEALRQQRQQEQDYERCQRQQPTPLTEEEQSAIRALAADIPALWHAPETSRQERKEMVRCLVERVVPRVHNHSEHVDVTIHWAGGFTSAHALRRPVASYEQLRDFQPLLDRAVAWRAAGQTAPQIAEQLNQEGFVPPKRAGRFTEEMVRHLLDRYGSSHPQVPPGPTSPNEWRLGDLAQELHMGRGRLREWIRKGWVHARKAYPTGGWIPWADQEELDRLRRLQDQSEVNPGVEYPRRLTNPKKLPGATANAARA